jgi:hypothetical protein
MVVIWLKKEPSPNTSSLDQPARASHKYHILQSRKTAELYEPTNQRRRGSYGTGKICEGS